MARTPKIAAVLSTALYAALTPINHDGEDYQVGETLELTDAQADALLGCNPPAIQFVGAAEAPDAPTE